MTKATRERWDAQLPPEAVVLLRWRNGAVEITTPGIERTSV